MRFASTLWISLSWIDRHASPASTSSLDTVLIDTSHTRLIERMDVPSQSIARIWVRLARGSLFMPIRYELLCLVSSIKCDARLLSVTAVLSPDCGWTGMVECAKWLSHGCLSF